MDQLKLKEKVNDGLKDPEEWCKRVFGIELNNSYDIYNINDDGVNNISEYDLINNNILNCSKTVKSTNFHYCAILHGCMNTCRGKLKYKNNWILLYSRCSYNIVMIMLTPKLKM